MNLLNYYLVISFYFIFVFLFINFIIFKVKEEEITSIIVSDIKSNGSNQICIIKEKKPKFQLISSYLDLIGLFIFILLL